MAAEKQGREFSRAGRAVVEGQASSASHQRGVLCRLPLTEPVEPEGKRNFQEISRESFEAF